MSLSKIEMFISNIGIYFLHERDTPVFEVNNILILNKDICIRIEMQSSKYIFKIEKYLV